MKKWGLPAATLAVLLAAGALLLWNAPNERTLGAGIKIVYVHVALTRVGTLGLLLTALLGLVGVIRGKEKLLSWLRTIYQASFACYLLGFVLAIWASWVNWGGVPLREPRFLTAINVLVLSAVCGLLLHWLPGPRLASLAALALSSLLFVGVHSQRMVLHPDDPISAAPEGIRLAFGGMFVLALLLCGWLVWQLRRRLSH